MNTRIDITPSDVFISWTGADASIKTQIAERLQGKQLVPLISDQHCQGNFVEWSRTAAVSASVFMPVITQNSLQSTGMDWELEEIHQKLSDVVECVRWKDQIIPVCESLELYRKFDRFGDFHRLNISTILLEYEDSEKRVLSESCLEEICLKTAERIMANFFDLYCHAVRSEYLKLNSYFAGVRIQDKNVQRTDMYINRHITENDTQHQEPRILSSPAELMIPGNISFIHGPAGCGKSQYISQIYECTEEKDLVIALKCSRSSVSNASIFDLMYEQFHKICGERWFYTKANFGHLLKQKNLILVLDGIDEITTQTATRLFVEKIEEFWRMNSERTALIFTGRNERDAEHLVIGSAAVRQFRMNPLTDDEIHKLSRNLFIQFGSCDTADNFYISIHDLNTEIRSNPLLLSQLAIIYNANGKIPQTAAGILEAVSEITFSCEDERELAAIPEYYKQMVTADIGDILKRFSKERYIQVSKGKNILFTKILSHVLKEKYAEDPSTREKRTVFLADYLQNRSVLIDGEFYHKMFLEYFTATYYYEQSFDVDYGEIENEAVIQELFSHYSDPYWADVIKLYLVKADSCIDNETSGNLYRMILDTASVCEYTLLFDTCRDLICHKEEAQLVLVHDILEKSAEKIYPPYGPLFWYVPEYELYETAVMAAEKLLGNAKALALVRDVCWIFGGKNTVAEVTDRVDGEKLYQAAKDGLSGVRKALCELFCIGETKIQCESRVYPRCFNIDEAKSYLIYRCGVLGRMDKAFKDSLNLYTHDSIHEVNMEYIGLISIPYCVSDIEETLITKSCRKLRGIILTPTQNTTMQYIAINSQSLEIVYFPENIRSLHKPTESNIRFWRENLSLKQDVLNFYQLIKRKKITLILYKILLVITSFVKTKSVRSFLSITKRKQSKRKEQHKVKITRKDLLSITGIMYHRGNVCLRNIEKNNTITFYDMLQSPLLESVKFNNNIKIISMDMFRNCVNLKSIVLPKTVKNINASAFCGCSELESISLNEGLTGICYQAFWGCSSLSEIHIPDSVSTIDAQAFGDCKSLRVIRMPNGLKVIEDSTFHGCENLENIIIPDSVEEIKSNAFKGCIKLPDIIIPKTTKVAPDAFKNCLNMYGTVHQINQLKERLIHEYELEILRADQSTLFNTTQICNEQYKDCNDMESIFIPDNITSIGDNAFENCKNLKSVILPDSVKKLGMNIFCGCDNLQYIRLPNGITELPWSMCVGCTNLTTINIPESVTSLGLLTFWNCRKLQYISLPTKLKYLESGVFCGCESLEHIEIPNNTWLLGSDIFKGCIKLRSITLPGNIKHICSGTFENCSSLENIHISGNITQIESTAFKNCSNLVTTLLSDTIEEIGSQAYENCSKILSLNIPKSVRIIGDNAFAGCTGLTSVTISYRFEGDIHRIFGDINPKIIHFY